MKTKSLLREKVWFPNIDKLVESKVKSCKACLIATPECKREPLQMSLQAAPWKEISVDFTDIPNKECLLLITDDYSRYPAVETVKSTRSMRTSSGTLSLRLSKKATKYWSKETRQRRKATHRITRYHRLSSRPKGLWSLQKMLKA